FLDAAEPHHRQSPREKDQPADVRADGSVHSEVCSAVSLAEPCRIRGNPAHGDLHLGQPLCGGPLRQEAQKKQGTSRILGITAVVLPKYLQNLRFCVIISSRAPQESKRG